MDTEKGIEDGIIAISCVATCNAPQDSLVWAGRARVDGTFDVTGLETGDYTVAFWDEAQSYILAFLQYSVVGDQGRVAGRHSRYRFFRRPHPDLCVRPWTARRPALTLSGSTGAQSRWNGTFNVTAVAPTAPANSVRVTRVGGQQPNTSPATLPTAVLITTVDPTPTDVGDILLPGWFTELTGYVFNDLNGDGFRDPDEPGVPDFGIGIRTRGNSVQDQGNNAANTDPEGFYDLSQAYPLGQFLIIEAYNPRYKSTGYTYTTDNDRNPDGSRVSHTIPSAQVDIAFLPVIGLSGTIDWGVQAYGTGTDYWSGDTSVEAKNDENGGIVGTVIYDTTRNEFDPAHSAQEDYQPGVPNLPVQLWKTQKDDAGNIITTPTGAVAQYGISKTTGADCPRPDDLRGTDAVSDADQDCKPFDYYITENWTRPTDCTALDVNGDPLEGELALPDHQAKEDVDYSHTADAPDCVEAPMSGLQIGGDGSVDGNYALTSMMKPESIMGAPAGGTALQDFYGDAQNNPDLSDALPNGDYVVEVVNPVDTINSKPISDPNAGGYIDGTTQNRLYRFTDETSINVFSGDVYVPQDGFSGPPAVDGDPGALLADPTSRIRYDLNSLGTGTVALCAGSLHTVAAIGSPELEALDPDFYAGGGNPYSGRDTPICDAKLVTVGGGHSMPAGFYMYTEVPLPAKFYGLVNDDLNVQTDRRSIMLGEVAGLANGPVGIYDENGNWKGTAHSDPNGFYEVLLPSTGTYNCPLPAGPCANVYRLVGNDPGTLSHRNTDYNPQFRTIATEFQAWPGVVHPVDQAPTHNGITIEGPAAQFGALSLCALADNNPVLFAIDKPFYNPNSGGDSSHTYIIQGKGFGTSGTLRLGTSNITTLSWSDTQITFGGSAVPSTAGPYQLSITNGQSTAVHRERVDLPSPVHRQHRNQHVPAVA